MEHIKKYNEYNEYIDNVSDDICIKNPTKKQLDFIKKLHENKERDLKYLSELKKEDMLIIHEP